MRTRVPRAVTTISNVHHHKTKSYPLKWYQHWLFRRCGGAVAIILAMVITWLASGMTARVIDPGPMTDQQRQLASDLLASGEREPVAYDAFAATGPELLVDHRLDSGQAWDNDSQSMSILQGVVITSDKGSNACVTTALAANGIFQARFNLGADGVNRGNAVRFRYQDAKNFLFAKLYRNHDGSTQRIELWKYDQGQPQRLVHARVEVTAAAWHTLTIIADGPTIRVLVDNGLRLVQYETFNQTAQQSCVTFENDLAIGQAIDDFEAWKLSTLAEHSPTDVGK